MASTDHRMWLAVEELRRHRPGANDHLLNVVDLGIDEPHRVAHVVDDGAGVVADRGQRGHGVRQRRMRLLPDDFAQDRDARQARPDAIVQVGGNLRADPFDGNGVPDPRAVDHECQGARTHGREGEEPPALPERRQHGELDHRGITRRAVGEDRTHEKAVAPRRGAGERNRACVRGRPVSIDAFELMLIPQARLRSARQG